MRLLTLSFVVIAALSSACSRNAPPAASKPLPVVVVAAQPVSPPIPPPAPSGPPSAFAGEALSRMLTCGDPDFLAQPSAKQSESLQTEPRLHCQPPNGHGKFSCTPAEPVSAFGLRMVGFTLSHENGGHGISVQLQGDMPALLIGFAQAYPKPTSSALEGKLVSLSNDDSVALRARESGEPSQVDYECRIAAPGELLFVTMNEPMTPQASTVSSGSTPELALTPTKGHAPAQLPTTGMSTRKPVEGTSSIAGHIEFPGESVPAMKVCAISDDGAAACVRTERDQTRYRIEHLPVGNYQIWAWLLVPEGDMRVMRATHEVQCIKAPCPPQPRTVALPDDTKVDGMTVNEVRASYPDQPVEPAG